MLKYVKILFIPEKLVILPLLKGEQKTPRYLVTGWEKITYVKIHYLSISSSSCGDTSTSPILLVILHFSGRASVIVQTSFALAG